MRRHYDFRSQSALEQRICFLFGNTATESVVFTRANRLAARCAVAVAGAAIVLVVIDALVEWLLDLPPWVALLMAFLFPALEASIFIGVVVPGEIAVLIAGVIANGGRLELWEVLVAATAGAIIGDFVGFEVGRRWGAVLLDKLPTRLVNPEHVERGREALRKRGAIAVLFGRWIAALRALIPGLAGMSDVRLRTFVIANAIGGTIWACVVGSLGYIAGKSYKTVEKDLGYTSYIFIGLFVVGIVALIIRNRVKKRRAPEPAVGQS